MRMRKNKNSDENFTSLLSAIDRQAAAPDQEFLKQLRERSAREFAAGAPDVSTNTPKSIHIAALRSIIMKSPITKLATAAIVAIACLIGLSLWRGTESGIALADVLAQIEKVKSVRCQVSYKITGGDPNKPYNVEIRSTGLTSQEYGSKYSTETLDPNGEWSQVSEKYILPRKKTTIVIYPTKKIYLCTELADAEVEQIQEENLARDPSMFFKAILSTKFESLGKSTIDGVEVAGFRNTDPNLFMNRGKNQQTYMKIWVDVKTLLPVRFEWTMDYFDKVGHEKNEQFVMHDFQWDISVDAAEFEPPMPDGYTVTLIKLPPNNEETAIQGLKLLFELLDKYPEKITDVDEVLRLAEKSETPAALRLKEELKGLTEKEEIIGLTEDEITIKLADFLMPIRGVAWFYFLLDQNKKDPAYYGKIVTPKDADKVLMRWKVSDNEYRVIYGDLHAETVTKEKLADLEAALPK